MANEVTLREATGFVEDLENAISAAIRRFMDQTYSLVEVKRIGLDPIYTQGQPQPISYAVEVETCLIAWKREEEE